MEDLCLHENSFLELLLYKSHKSSMKYVNYINSLALCATTNFVTAILHGLNKMMYDIKIIWKIQKYNVKRLNHYH